MKTIQYILALSLFAGSFTACNKIIDLNPISNIGAGNFYDNYKDVQVALTGCYNGLQSPLQYQWMVTELRSDDSKQGVPTSSSTTNLDFNQLNMYTPGSTLPEIYNYWLSVYTNIRSINYVLKSLGVKYSNGTITIGIGTATTQMTGDEINKLAGEALFMRAYHYFNLVRLFGGIFVLTDPTTPQESQQIDRSAVADVYKLIVADLQKSITLLPRTNYANISPDDLGKANVWSSEALLAKVYLTLNRKTDALNLLNDIISNSGYGLETSYSDIFSVSNEMNQEILFAVRFKAGGVGLGNFMPNNFAPQGSGNAIVNGDGSGWNYPTNNLDSSFAVNDTRHPFSIGTYQKKLYAKKFVVPVVAKNDGENDFPILRFADVLLMKAEATGFDGASGSSVAILNQIRARAGATAHLSGSFQNNFYKYPTDESDQNAITTSEEFITALLNERRWEFAFENQRLFDLIRFNVAVPVMQNYFALEYNSHYKNYSPQPTLSSLQGNVTEQHLLLPIPQREIDANTTIKIQQNPGY